MWLRAATTTRNQCQLRAAQPHRIVPLTDCLCWGRVDSTRVIARLTASRWPCRMPSTSSATSLASKRFLSRAAAAAAEAMWDLGMDAMHAMHICGWATGDSCRANTRHGQEEVLCWDNFLKGTLFDDQINYVHIAQSIQHDCKDNDSKCQPAEEYVLMALPRLRRTGAACRCMDRCSRQQDPSLTGMTPN